METSFKNALETQCKQEQMEREVLEAWINDSSLEMEICDYCVHDRVFDERCIGFKWDGKPLER